MPTFTRAAGAATGRGTGKKWRAVAIRGMSNNNKNAMATAQPYAHNPAQVSDTAGRNTRERARDTESLILYWLHRFGYLRATQVAALVYTQHHQSEAMARRTLLRLERRGLVLRHKGQIGEHGIYALSLAGARAVFDVHGVRAESGKDVMRLPSRHRILANDAAIRLVLAGAEQVWTEREIQTHSAPFHHLGKKVPDVLWADAEGYAVWAEIEASRRGGRDMQALARWLAFTAFPLGLDHMVVLNPPQDNLVLERVRFVLAVPQAHSFPERLYRALQALLEPAGYDVRDFADNTLEFEMPGRALQVGFD